MKRHCRRQAGYLYEKSGSWVGQWRSYSAKGLATKRATVIGRVSEMSKERARTALASIIKRESLEYGALRYLPPRASPAMETLFRERSQQFFSMSPAKRGAVAELAVVTDLLSRGYDVYTPVGPPASCDMLVEIRGELFRVEVKSAEVKNGKALCSVKRNLGKFDLLAVVDRLGKIHYAASASIDKVSVHQLNLPVDKETPQNGTDFACPVAELDGQITKPNG